MDVSRPLVYNKVHILLCISTRVNSSSDMERMTQLSPPFDMVHVILHKEIIFSYRK